MAEWVKVSEDKPEHNKKVLLYFPDGEIGAGYLKYFGEKTEVILGGMVCKYKEPTHWMELPPAPDTTF